MENVFLKIGKIILSILIACILLSLFALLYNNSGPKITNFTGATASKWDGAQFVSNMKEGLSWFITDKNGFNNAETKNSVDVLIMGDSHIEAVQVFQNENLTYLLDTNTKYNCYNIGISGNYIDSCVKNIRKAVAEYQPSKYVIIDLHDDSINTSIDRMNEIISGAETASPVMFEHGIMNYIKRIPCVKPLLYGLTNWINVGVSRGGNTIEKLSPFPEGYAETQKKFLSIVSDTAKENGIIPIIFYQPYEQLNPDGTVTYKTDEVYFERFASTCEELGIVFVDMTDSFKWLYANERQLAHGFINTAVGSGHLNKYGHRLIAEKLAEVMQELEEE
ncbi:MAG: hypothetical protein Q4E35_01345 [Eubacteriales bacterium]|nr:hypothetical protein [Eubacteriales bacterium]